jgi:hypothetical protein
VTLVCPSCGREHPDSERFCARCGVPLVVEGGPREAEVTEQQARARKIKPQYAEGELVRVAIGRQLPEAELIQNLLLEEGVPSTLRRTRGFDVPEMLAAGPRDVLVPASGVATAREVLLQADLGRRPEEPIVSPVRLAAALLAGLAVLGILVAIVELVG